MEIDPWAFCRAGLVQKFEQIGQGARFKQINNAAEHTNKRTNKVETCNFSRLNDANCQLMQLECQVIGWVGSPRRMPIQAERNTDGSLQTASNSCNKVGTQNHNFAEHCLRVQGRALLNLNCQLCGSPVKVDVTFERTLVLKQTQEQADAFEQLDVLQQNAPNGFADMLDETDAIVCEQVLNLHDVVEDEILLSMPMYPRHAECPTNAEPQKTHQPFSGLANLLKT